MKSIYFIRSDIVSYYGLSSLGSKFRRLHMSDYAITDGKLIKSKDGTASNKKLSAKKILEMVEKFDGVIYSCQEPVRVADL